MLEAPFARRVPFSIMKKARLHLDYETFSEVNLKKAGAYRYAEDPSTEILMACYALNDGPVNVWIPWDLNPEEFPWDRIEVYYKSRIGEAPPSRNKNIIWLDPGAEIHVQYDCPDDLREWMANPNVEKAAHNAQFERVIGDWCQFAIDRGVPQVPIKQWVCTAAKAAVYGLPRDLEGATNALGTFPKDSVGKNIMLSLAKPRTGKERRYTWWNAADRYIETLHYCMDDVHAERDLDNNVPDITKYERTRWRLDQCINDRGVAIDEQAIDDLLYLIEQYKARLVDFCKRHTEHIAEVKEKIKGTDTVQLVKKTVRISPGQNAALAEWIRSNGYPQLENLQAPTIKEAVKDPECPPEIKRILKCYSLHQMKSVDKYKAMKTAKMLDGRIRGMFVFYGAGPGRWSSRIVQLQNMLRPLIKDVDLAIEMMSHRDLELIEWMWDMNPMKVFASCTRGCLIADEGMILTAFDFAQIESRIQAWVSDAQWKLDFFMSDTPFKIYHKTGSMMFNLPMEEIVDRGEDQKYTGAKIGELACGYQGWKGAVEKMARDMGLKLTMPGDEIAALWRDANKEQVKTWSHLEDAMREAIANPGQAFKIPNGKAMFRVTDRWLHLRLPSGRTIKYLDPMLLSDGTITYMGINTYTRKWERVETYGGKIMQNFCEGVGWDLLTAGLIEMEKAGYKTIMSVHDEGVFEIAIDFGSEEEAMELMTPELSWAAGLPVKCDGWRKPRYRK